MAVGTRRWSGATFRVDDVVPAAEGLPEVRMYEAVRGLVQGEVESCCDYHGSVVGGIHYHALLAAVYEAFSGHRPLVLGPDAVWVTIAQGVAQHMTIHAERLRGRFVMHQGRADLRVDVDGFVKGSPENPWEQAFAEWSGQIREHVGAEVHDALVCDFSTTGAVERAASEIVLMDIFERYFHYEAYAICGIPEITLEGTVGDWERVREKIEVLETFDMGWWLEHLRPICDQFVRAMKGDVDLKHWGAICKLREAYGGNMVNGWVGKLFPYLREFIDGPVRRLNPIFETGEGFQTFMAPSGLSQVPFEWTVRDLRRQDTRYEMEAIGGMVGVEQDSGTLALRPKVGWAVREAGLMGKLIGRVKRDHVCREGYTRLTQRLEGRDFDYSTGMPEELGTFCYATNGAELFGAGKEARFRILPVEEQSYVKDKDDVDDAWIKPIWGKWRKFCETSRGDFLAIDAHGERDFQMEHPLYVAFQEASEAFEPEQEAEKERIDAALAAWRKENPKAAPGDEATEYRRLYATSAVMQRIDRTLRAMPFPEPLRWNNIVFCRRGTERITGKERVVAKSFGEFLQRALESGGVYWWEA